MKYILVILITIISYLPAWCQVIVVTPQQSPDMRYHQYPGYTYYGGDQRNPSQYLYTNPGSTTWDTRIIDRRNSFNSFSGGVMVIDPAFRQSDDDDDD